MSTPLAQPYDVLVVGAGIAGASAAAALARRGRRVALLEREDQPGYHTTGRSAALLTPFYGNEVVRRLNLAGAAFYRDPPPGFAADPLLSPRGALYVARDDQLDHLEAEYDAARRLGGNVRPVDADEAARLVPALRPGHVARAFLDPDAAEMDVAAILHGFLRELRRHGGALRTGAEVLAVGRAGDRWLVGTSAGEVAAPVLVNAAGAWADGLAALAGLGPLGVAPLRRTAVLLDPPPGRDVRGWPVVADVGEEWYAKPEGGRLLCSPADETPAEPGDAQPDELDVALCVDRVQQALDLPVRRVVRAWAGLRCFAPDRTPVVGEDPRAPGFVWLAGQGGYGIMTAPVLADLAAHLVAGASWTGGIDPAALAPARLL